MQTTAFVDWGQLIERQSRTICEYANGIEFGEEAFGETGVGSTRAPRRPPAFGSEPPHPIAPMSIALQTFSGPLKRWAASRAGDQAI
jgi:hypothetical protein